jgi:glycosyltransferase involved in cell wall biosynthesis
MRAPADGSEPGTLHVLIAHNRYQQYGGEDAVVDAEVRMLESAGHRVSTHFVDNDAIHGLAAQLRTAAGTVYNAASRRTLAARLRDERPDVVHVHNFFPRLSPSIFDACRDAGVPSVMTVHNFRLTCSSAFLFRDGHICEDCVRGTAYNAVLHGCYRGSRAGSAVLASMIAYHRRVGTWQTKVDRFIALTEFSRAKLIEAGLPADRLVVKANCLPQMAELAPSPLPAAPSALFFGRLSVEKGVDVLLEAWRGVDVPLTVIGDGPERARLEALAPAHVRFLGHQPREEIFARIAAASLIVVPSLWYENFPMAVVETQALGRPVLASDVGALREIVPDTVGRRFRLGDADDLARVAREMVAAPAELAEMAAAARQTYEARLSPAVNLAQLVGIYQSVIGAAGVSSN